MHDSIGWRVFAAVISFGIFMLVIGDRSRWQNIVIAICLLVESAAMSAAAVQAVIRALAGEK